MSTRWVNYKHLRESIDFAQVLADYGVDLNPKGEQHQGFCPLPEHQGKKRSPSFSANLARGIWQCFGCGAKGNVLDFVARMEGLDPEDKTQFRKAALLLLNRYGPGGSNSTGKEPTPSEDQQEETRPQMVNLPLDFELKQLDPAHPYLQRRKLKPETIAHFGIGFCKQGLMKGRIAIPLHDETGQLIGYAGRLVDGNAVDQDHPKYKFPGTRLKSDLRHEFRKSAFLFNGHQIRSPVKHLIVVEGFFGVFWLFQCGWPNTIALMGSSISDKQAQLMLNLIQPSGILWIMADGDTAGRQCANDLLLRFSPNRFTRWVKLSEGMQPDDCSPNQLFEHFSLIQKSDPF